MATGPGGSGDAPKKPNKYLIFSANVDGPNKGKNPPERRREAVRRIVNLPEMPMLVLVQELQGRIELYDLPDNFRYEGNNEAGILFNTNICTVEELPRAILDAAIEELGLGGTVEENRMREYVFGRQNGSEATEARLCIRRVRPNNSNDEFIAISWHGQYKLSMEDRYVYLTLLAIFAINLEHITNLPVLFAGDFNLEIGIARDVLHDFPTLQLFEYEASVHRQDLSVTGVIDYIFGSRNRFITHGIGWADMENYAAPFNPSEVLNHDAIFMYFSLNNRNTDNDGNASVRPDTEGNDDDDFRIYDMSSLSLRGVRPGARDASPGDEHSESTHAPTARANQSASRSADWTNQSASWEADRRNQSASRIGDSTNQSALWTAGTTNQSVSRTADTTNQSASSAAGATNQSTSLAADRANRAASWAAVRANQSASSTNARTDQSDATDTERETPEYSLFSPSQRSSLEEPAAPEEESTIMTYRPGTSMQIFVKPVDGPTITLDVAPTDTTHDVKRKVEDKIGMEPRFQRLVYANKQLEDHRTLNNYGVHREATLFLLMRLPGG